MDTPARHPLAPLTRSLSLYAQSSTRPASYKRPASPDEPLNTNTKRRKQAVVPRVTTQVEKRDKKLIRQEQEAEFRDKYSRAIRNYSFYFDIDPALASKRKNAEMKIRELGGCVEDFFSKDITHLISNASLQDEKENAAKPEQPLDRLKSKTIMLEAKRGSSLDLISKAKSFGLKIWSLEKLLSILDRCLHNPYSAQHSNESIIQPSLSRLLQSERVQGTTERDPSERRHNYIYFSKSSYFVLVEDVRGVLATITAQEYPIPRGEASKPSWPVLHCHHKSRGPFIEYDEKERRKWEKMQRLEMEQEEEREARRESMARKRRELRNQNLRRTVSLGYLHQDTASKAPGLAADDNNGSQAMVQASGYLPSAGIYLAGSGNSLAITSATGTTTNGMGQFYETKLPPHLRTMLQHEVVTSRKALSNHSVVQDESASNTLMGPPAAVGSILKRSKSTNSLRPEKRYKPEKREEGSKPGYCESCRIKFEDFNEHIRSRKHRKFAANDANFSALDVVLARVKRRTLDEVELERMKREVVNTYGESAMDDFENCTNAGHTFSSPTVQHFLRRRSNGVLRDVCSTMVDLDD